MGELYHNFIYSKAAVGWSWRLGRACVVACVILGAIDGMGGSRGDPAARASTHQRGRRRALHEGIQISPPSGQTRVQRLQERRRTRSLHRESHGSVHKPRFRLRRHRPKQDIHASGSI